MPPTRVTALDAVQFVGQILVGAGPGAPAATRMYPEMLELPGAFLVSRVNATLDRPCENTFDW